MKETQQRASKDDFELIKELILENKGLHQRVLDKMRMLRYLGNDNIIEDAKKKQKEASENKKGKRKKKKEKK
jgi:hypothetical protein